MSNSPVYNQQQQPQGGYQQQQQQPQYQQQYQQPPPQQNYQQQQPQQQQYQQPTKQQPQPINNTAGYAQPQQQGGNVVQGIPLYADSTDPELNKRFVKGGYNDVWAAGLFAAHLVVTIIMAIVSAKQVSDDNQNVETRTTPQQQDAIDSLGKWLPVACLCSVLAASGSLTLMRVFPKQYIIVANVLIIVLNVCVAIYLASQGAYFGAFINLIFAVIAGVWLWFVRNRIPFAGVLLSHSVATVTRHFGTIVTSFLALLALGVYLAFWCLMAIPAVKFFADSNDSGNQKDESPAAQYVVVLLLLLVFFWTTQVIANVVHVTASGTVATWYFIGQNNMPRNPSVASLKRAVTTSFGSICFGSLVVAILKVIQYMVRSAARNQNSFVACIAVCLIGIIERLMEYFNVYAFTHVAIYGTSYIQAAKQTWAMVKECGFAAYFNDCLIWPVLSLTTFFNSLALAIIFGLSSSSFMVGLVVFCVCYVIHVLIFRPVYSGIVTIFVCVAECPEMMATANPQFAAEFEAASALAQTSTC